MPRCTLCRYPALGRFYLDRGCIALPDVTEQNLCAQHIVKANPRGGFELLEDYTLPGGLRLADVLKGGAGVG